MTLSAATGSPCFSSVEATDQIPWPLLPGGLEALDGTLRERTPLFLKSCGVCGEWWSELLHPLEFYVFFFFFGGDLTFILSLG